MKVMLKNTQSGMLKSVPLGFSWTTFFFGGFPALFRGDLKWAVIMWIVGGAGVAIAVASLGFLFILPWVFWLVFAAVYNKKHVQDLLTKGFVPADNRDHHTLARRGIGIAATESRPPTVQQQSKPTTARQGIVIRENLPTPLSPTERSDQAPKPSAKSLELTVLAVAKANGGVVSPPDVAMEAECEIDKAKEQLDAMVDKGHVELHPTKSGSMMYVIPSMLTNERRDELEPMV